MRTNISTISPTICSPAFCEQNKHRQWLVEIDAKLQENNFTEEPEPRRLKIDKGILLTSVQSTLDDYTD
jgi:hypothetical protein